jgi:hypothetical protein
LHNNIETERKSMDMGTSLTEKLEKRRAIAERRARVGIPMSTNVDESLARLDQVLGGG